MGPSLILHVEFFLSECLRKRELCGPMVLFVIEQYGARLEQYISLGTTDQLIASSIGGGSLAGRRRLCQPDYNRLSGASHDMCSLVWLNR